VSEVIDQGSEVVVLFSVLNVQEHAVELMPPQVQLAGQVKKGAIIRRRVWSNSEQLPVEEFRMSRRRLGPGERADVVVSGGRAQAIERNAIASDCGFGRCRPPGSCADRPGSAVFDGGGINMHRINDIGEKTG
jgi:hypothetical protein